MSDHTVTYKACKLHRREVRERDCADCRRLTFRATMAAWGMPVKVPTYKGGWPVADAYNADWNRGAAAHACRTTDDDERKLAAWIRNATAWNGA